MKKAVATFLSLFLVFAASGAFAAEGPDAQRAAHREAMKKIKQAQRTERKDAAPAGSAEHKPGFWEKEGERSGLGGSGSRVGTFVKNLNPVPFFKHQKEQYDARKAAGRQNPAVAVK